MRKSMNYVLAAAVFALVMVMMTGGSFGIVAASYMIGVLLEGQEGVARASAFLLEHQNLFSCLLYLIPASVFIPWLYLERTGKQGAARFAASQTEKLSPVCFVWTAVLIYAVQHAVSIIIGFLAVLLPEAVEHYSELVEAAGMTQYSPVWVVSMLILPPLVEETVFRGADHGIPAKGRGMLLGGQCHTGVPVRRLSRKSRPGGLCFLYRAPVRLSV